MKNTDGTSDPPKVTKNSKLVSILTIHDIAALFASWVPLFETRRDWLKSNTRVPTIIPPHIPALVAAVDVIDRRSTFWRYPVSDSALDEEKFEFQNSSVDDLQKKIARGERTVSLFVTDSMANVSAVYSMQNKVLPGEIQQLHELAEFLSVMHFALRCELCGGW